MRIIGLTGGYATGKSTVSKRLKSVYSIPVFDADACVHYLLDNDALPYIKQEFSKCVPRGTVDRALLANTVFKHTASLLRLEAILHPLVRHYAQRFHMKQRRLSRRTCVLDIPLLFESHMDDLCSEIWCLSAPMPVQTMRAKKRGISIQRHQEILRRQLPQSVKIHRANTVIYSGLSKATLYRQIDSALLHQPYV